MFLLKSFGPIPAGSYEADHARANAELRSQGSSVPANAAPESIADGSRLLKRNLSSAVSLAKGIPAPLFGISHVVQMSSEGEVARVDAGWVVAGVQDVEVAAVDPRRQFERHPVSVHKDAARGRPPVADFPVLPIGRRKPLPALILVADLDLGPKPHQERISLFMSSHRSHLGNLILSTFSGQFTAAKPQKED